MINEKINKVWLDTIHWGSESQSVDILCLGTEQRKMSLDKISFFSEKHN